MTNPAGVMIWDFVAFALVWVYRQAALACLFIGDAYPVGAGVEICAHGLYSA